MEFNKFEDFLKRIKSGEISDMETEQLKQLKYLQVYDIVKSAPKGTLIREKAYNLLLQWAMEYDSNQ